MLSQYSSVWLLTPPGIEFRTFVLDGKARFRKLRRLPKDRAGKPRPIRTKIGSVIVLQEKHKLATRWFHWVNFPLLLAMMFSGLLIYWAYDPYRVGVGGVTLFHFFSGLVLQGHRGCASLALGMAVLHFAFAWLFALNGIAYMLYTFLSGEWRELLPDRYSLREALQVAKHDAGFQGSRCHLRAVITRRAADHLRRKPSSSWAGFQHC